VNDDELLAYVKAADPAGIPHAPQPDTNRLVEAIMTTETQSRPAPIPARGRRPRLLVAAAAAVVVMGGVLTWAVTAGDPAPVDRSPVSLTFATRGAVEVACVAPTVESLRGYPLAFEGTVTAKAGDRVDLRVEHWFRGGSAETVRLSNDEQLMEASVFEIGRRYLVTAENGIVPICGGTSEATAEDRSLFREAFE
jgi:hypothetical protein